MFWNRVWDFGKKSPDQYWSILIYIDQYWSILINIDLYWLILIYIDQYWSILIRTRHNSCFETESVNLIKKSPDRYWLILINIDQGCQVTWKTWKTWKSLENGKNKKLNLEKPWKTPKFCRFPGFSRFWLKIRPSSIELYLAWCLIELIEN